MAVEEIANLQIKIDSAGGVVATNNLKALAIQSVRTERATDKLGKTSKSTTASIVKGGLAIGGITTAVILLRQEVARFVETNKKFEQSMSAVKAVTQGTEKDMKALTEQAKKLGEGTAFSASQAAEGMKFLGQAGFETSEILSAMPGLLDLAAAGSLDLGRAADIASNIMSGFNIEASESNRVADIMAAIASKANTNVEQLGEGMKFVAPVAAALGVSLEETSAAMGVLSDAGLQSTLAGTGLRQVLASLLTATPKAEQALDKMGLTLADVSPQTNTLSEIVEKLADSGIGATEAFEIFGRRGAPAILALTSKTGRLRELNEEMKSAEGTARTMAETLLDNLAGSVTKFDSALEGALLRLGEQSGLIGSLRGATDAMTEFLLELGKTNEELLKEKPIEDIIARINKLSEAMSRASKSNKRGVASIGRDLRELKAIRDEVLNERLKNSPQALDAAVKRVSDDIIAASNGLKELDEQIEKSEAARAAKRSSGRGRGRSRSGSGQVQIDQLKAQREELQKNFDVLKSTEKTILALRTVEVQKGTGFGFEITKEIDKATLELEAMRAKFVAENGDLALFEDLNIIGPATEQVQQIKNLERIIELKKEEQATFNKSGATPEDTANKEKVAALAKAELEQKALEDSRAARAENLEGIKQFLATERELIQMQHDERVRIVEENTREGSARQQVLLEGLEDRLAEELEREQEAREAKVTAIEEEFLTELERLQKHHDDRRQIITDAEHLTAEERNKLLTRLDKKHSDDTKKLADKEAKARLKTAQDLFGNLTTIAGVFADDQKGIMKGLHAVNQGFQVAQAIMEIQGALSKAWNSAPFPANIGAVASVAAGTSGIISTISGSNFSAREHGGLIPPGAMGLVGENGPELVSGPMNVLSTRTTADRGRMGMQVQVINNVGADVRVEQEDEGRRARIIIDAAVKEARDERRQEFSEETLAADIKTGQGVLNAVLEDNFKSTRIN